MTDRKEMVEDVMKDAYGCASFNVQCGKCKETTIVYVIPGSILKRIEDAVPLERAQAAAIAAASAVRSTDEKWEHSIGNAAKMREVLEQIKKVAESNMKGSTPSTASGKDPVEAWPDLIRGLAESALSAKPRNCDRSFIDHVDMYGQFKDWCNKKGHTINPKLADDAFDWLLAVEDAKEEKGSADGKGVADSALKSYCTYWREMEYSNEHAASHILARGCYEGYHFLAINSHGRIPCGYVNVGKTVLAGKDYDTIDIECHGGLTFGGKHAPVTCEDGWWIGWDYAHLGDYDPTSAYEDDGVRYGTVDVVRECVNVIRQVLDLCKKGGVK